VKVAVAGGGAEVEFPQVRVGAFEREVAVEAIAQIDAHNRWSLRSSMVPMSIPERWLEPRSRPPYQPASCAAATDRTERQSCCNCHFCVHDVPFDVEKLPSECPQARAAFSRCSGVRSAATRVMVSARIKAMSDSARPAASARLRPRAASKPGESARHAQPLARAVQEFHSALARRDRLVMEDAEDLVALRFGQLELPQPAQCPHLRPRLRGAVERLRVDERGNAEGKAAREQERLDVCRA
jgi:hypothetical protein